VEEDVFLRDHGDLFAEGADDLRADVRAADDLAGPLVEPRNQIDQRGFPGAGADSA
jgi:hypothetical protein